MENWILPLIILIGLLAGPAAMLHAALLWIGGVILVILAIPFIIEISYRIETRSKK